MAFMRNGGMKFGKDATKGLGKTISAQKPTFHRSRGLVDKVSSRHVLVFFGMLVAITMLSGKLNAESVNAQPNTNRQERNVGIDPAYDYKMIINFVPNVGAFGIQGAPVAVSDETLAQLGIAAFSGDEKIVSARSPVGWMHYVVNERWKGILAIKQPINKTDNFCISVISVNDDSYLQVPFKYVSNSDIFAILTTGGVLFNGVTCGIGGYVPLSQILNTPMNHATITLEESERGVFVRVVIPTQDRELHIDNAGQAQLASR